MEAESKASARCHSLEEQILQLKAKLKDVKTMVKTVESKGAAPAPNQSLQKERDQLFVSRVGSIGKDDLNPSLVSGPSSMSRLRNAPENQDPTHLLP